MSKQGQLQDIEKMRASLTVDANALADVCRSIVEIDALSKDSAYRRYELIREMRSYIAWASEIEYGGRYDGLHDTGKAGVDVGGHDDKHRRGSFWQRLSGILRSCVGLGKS